MLKSNYRNYLQRLILFLMLGSVSALAQNGQTRTNSAPAALHISIYIVPITYTVPANRLESAGTLSVAYNMPTMSPRLDVFEETSAIYVANKPRAVAGYLKTTTVVPK
jgi:hypothetical protein